MNSNQTQDQSPEPSVTIDDEVAVTPYFAYVGVNEAARLTGKGKQQIYRDIQAGKLSWLVQPDGKKQLQIADLDRVYTLKPQGVTGQKNSHQNRVLPTKEEAVTSVVITERDLEIARLQERCDAKDEALRKAEAQIRDLQQNRDQLLDQNNRLTLLLPAPSQDRQPPVKRHNWWSRITGK